MCNCFYNQSASCFGLSCDFLWSTFLPVKSFCSNLENGSMYYSVHFHQRNYQCCSRSAEVLRSKDWSKLCERWVHLLDEIAPWINFWMWLWVLSSLTQKYMFAARFTSVSHESAGLSSCFLLIFLRFPSQRDGSVCPHPAFFYVVARRHYSSSEIKVFLGKIYFLEEYVFWLAFKCAKCPHNGSRCLALQLLSHFSPKEIEVVCLFRKKKGRILPMSKDQETS